MEIFNWMKDLLAEYWWLGIISIVTFIGTIVALPIILIKIPEDYFIHDKENPYHPENIPKSLRLFFLIIKNICGGVFLLFGIILLLLPGQGIITILIGISFINFPGKKKLERKIIMQPVVFNAINAIRKRAGYLPLQIPETGSTPISE